jgi:hypothetical protein
LPRLRGRCIFCTSIRPSILRRQSFAISHELHPGALRNKQDLDTKVGWRASDWHGVAWIPILRRDQFKNLNSSIFVETRFSVFWVSSGGDMKT